MELSFDYDPARDCELAHYRGLVIRVERETDGLGRPSFSEEGTRIPNGCGEYQAELRATKRWSGLCWESEAFFIVWNE